MGIRLLELKIDTEFDELERHDFLIKESVQELIINWECLRCGGDVEEYIKKNPFPEDKRYNKEEFLRNVELATGYILLSVEKTETAEYIAELIYDII